MAKDDKKDLKTEKPLNSQKESEAQKLKSSKKEEAKALNSKETRSVKEEGSVDKPEATQTSAESTVTKKEEEASKPEEVSAKKKEEASKPEEASVKKKEEASKPEEASVKKKEEASKPEEVSAKKKEEASKPEEASVKKKEEASKPEEVSAKKKEEASKPEAKKVSKNAIKLKGLFAFKMSMTRFYNDKGDSLPVTALKYEPSFVSQIKTAEKDSYSAVQVAFKAQKNKRCSKAIIQHLKPAGFKEGARFIKEIKQELPENIQVGDELSIHSIEKGDLVKISALSKGKGFAGVMKRWNFRGGKASHGSKSHRGTGSIGQHTKPGRVFPGRKMPGRHGFQQVSRSKVPVVDVLPEEGIIFVKGSVPGARDTLVSLQKI